jgi:hypothetical protein
MLKQAIAILLDAQAKLNALEDADFGAVREGHEAAGFDDAEDFDGRRLKAWRGQVDWSSRLFVANIGGALAVEYYGQNYETKWDLVQEALAAPEVAPHIALLRFTGPDDGANGLRSWDFAKLIAAKPQFPRLTHFHIQPSEPADHNFGVVEDGQLPSLLALMPHLHRLVLPQAPEPAFFSLALDELRYLKIGMEHRTRGFIEHLATTGSLPELVKLDFADSLGPWLNTEPQPAEWTSTPFAHYEALLKSNAVPKMSVLFLRNAVLPEPQFRALQAMRKDLQFAAILAPPHIYVSHWGRTKFPYRHLLPRE